MLGGDSLAARFFAFVPRGPQKFFLHCTRGPPLPFFLGFGLSVPNSDGLFFVPREFKPSPPQFVFSPIPPFGLSPLPLKGRGRVVRNGGPFLFDISVSSGGCTEQIPRGGSPRRLPRFFFSLSQCHSPSHQSHRQLFSSPPLGV